jgi:glycosyltransferase involved in cell wall biosynthesis
VRVAIIHPRFLALGGGEKVIEALGSIYPQADLFTIFSSPEMVPLSLRDRRIYTTFLNNIPGTNKWHDTPWAKRLHDKLAVLYPLAIDSLDLSAYDLVISSAGPATFGVSVPQSTLHVCYCLSPERGWWDLYPNKRHLSNKSLMRKLFYTARTGYIRRWEFDAAQRVDHFIAISGYISQRIHKYFRRNSTIIYPPVDTARGYVAPNRGDYFLSVCRLVPAKRVDLLIDACNRLGRRLVVVGTGPQEKGLKALAGPSIEFLGFVADASLPELYANCRAFLFACDEDFGIVPVEAQSYGRPVIAYGHGGSLETVRVSDPGGRPDTGVFFAEQTVESVLDAILRFEAREVHFIPEEIQAHARQFDTSVFVTKMTNFVDAAMQNG